VENKPVLLSPALLAVLVLVGGFIAGAVLIALDFVLIGILVGCAAVPVAFVAWLTAGERS
jgi:hypothetical protein